MVRCLGIRDAATAVPLLHIFLLLRCAFHMPYYASQMLFLSDCHARLSSFFVATVWVYVPLFRTRDAVRILESNMLHGSCAGYE